MTYKLPVAGYCGTCIEKYGTSLAEVLKEHPWRCFGCRNECTCQSVAVRVSELACTRGANAAGRACETHCAFNYLFCAGLCTGCRKRGRSTAEPVVPSIHPKFIAWFEAAGIPHESELLRYPGPPPELPGVAESQRMAEQGLPEPICPNVWAKPFVPARLNLASSAYRGVSSQGNRYRARICVDKVSLQSCVCVCGGQGLHWTDRQTADGLTSGRHAVSPLRAPLTERPFVSPPTPTCRLNTPFATLRRRRKLLKRTIWSPSASARYDS